MSTLNITRVPQFLDPWFTEIEQVWDEIEASVNDIETRVAALEATPATSAWGDLTGTLADQTDLQAALDAKLAKVQADNYRVMATNGSATIVETAAITAAKALKSDANGIPTHFDTSVEPSITELQKVKGVTSAIQTQLNSKADNVLSGSYTPAAGTVAIGDSLEDAIEKIVGNSSAGTIDFYSYLMTGDLYTVSNSFTNVPGGSMAQVGSVQVTGVIVNGTSDILSIGFTALSIPSVTADLLLGFQIGANIPVWGSYNSRTSLTAHLAIQLDGIAAGTYTIKLMAAKLGTGNVDIAASDSTTYGIDQIPAGATFTVEVIHR